MCCLLICRVEELRTFDALDRVDLLVMVLQGHLVAEQSITLLTFVCVDSGVMCLAIFFAAKNQSAVFASKLAQVVFLDMPVQISLLIEVQRTLITLDTDTAFRRDMLLHFCICVECFCAFRAFSLVGRRLDMGV
jgi:hypothetical protein